MDRASRTPQDTLQDNSASPFKIFTLKKENQEDIVNIIRQNLDSFEDAGSILAASFRRLDRFYETYSAAGATYFIVCDTKSGRLIGGAGLGPMAGLPFSEGIGEIRELVIEKDYRNQGLGGRLLARCLEGAKTFNYRRLYLETTTQMAGAQRLFRRFGFRPIEQKTEPDTEKKIACYYMFEAKEP